MYKLYIFNINAVIYIYMCVTENKEGIYENGGEGVSTGPNDPLTMQQHSPFLFSLKTERWWDHTIEECTRAGTKKMKDKILVRMEGEMITWLFSLDCTNHFFFFLLTQIQKKFELGHEKVTKTCFLPLILLSFLRFKQIFNCAWRGFVSAQQ